MADVLLVYVQEDRAYAEGISASLERSGLTVADGGGTATGNVESPCVVVLWSAHSTRSALVRDLAIRAQREGKLITAKLAGCEAPLGFARPAPYDLSHWNGDPDDAALDPLFFAADRLVCAVRINDSRQKTAASQPPIHPQGSHLHAPNVRPMRAGPIASVSAAPRAARIEPESAQTSPARTDPVLPPNVAEEAAAWKRIEHSADPKDFLDYLTTFSPNGMFCELAQLKLDKLTPKPKAAFIPHTPSPHAPKARADSTRERRAAARSAEPQPDPQPEREARAEPPRSAREQRYEPLPQSRPETRYEPRPRPRPEEDYELESGPIGTPARSATNRPRRRAPEAPVQNEPREGGGLPWRPLLIVALLAAGGATFFQLFPKQAPPINAPSPDTAEASRAGPLDDLTAPGGGETPALGSGNAVLGGLAAPARPAAPKPAQVETAPQPAPQAPPSSSSSPSSVIAFVPPTTPAPPPQIAFTPPPQSIPTQPAPTPPASVQVAPTPAPAPTQPASAQTASTAGDGYIQPTYTRRPSASQLENAYPTHAARVNASGKVTMDCLILQGGGLSCAAVSVTPTDYGFSAAATDLSRIFRVAPTTADGAPTAGKRTKLTISFAP